MAERLHHQVSREAQARQAFSSSRVIGPVVSCEPTEVISVRSTRPDECLSHRRHDLPFLRQREAAIALSDIFRLTEHTLCGRPSASRALVVRPRPIIAEYGRQHALHQSARRFSVRSRQQFAGFVVTHFTFVRVNVITSPMFRLETSTSIGSAPASPSC